MITNWLLSGVHRVFALLYHWRVLPGLVATEGAFAEFGGLDRAAAEIHSYARDVLNAYAEADLTVSFLLAIARS
jgi:hypothetical protein